MIKLVFTNDDSAHPDYPATAPDVVLGPFEAVTLPDAAWDKPTIGLVAGRKVAYDIRREHAGWAITIGGTVQRRAKFMIQ